MLLHKKGRHAENSQRKWCLWKKKFLSQINCAGVLICKVMINIVLHVYNNLSPVVAILVCSAAFLAYGGGVDLVAWIVSIVLQLFGFPILLQVYALYCEGRIPRLLSKSHFLYAYMFTIQFLIGVYLIKYYPELYSNNKVVGLVSGYVQCLSSLISLMILLVMDVSKSEWIKKWIIVMRIYPILWLCVIIVESIVSLFIGSFFDLPVMIDEKNIPESNKAWDVISSDLMIGVFLVEQVIEIGKFIIEILEDFLDKSVKYL